MKQFVTILFLLISYLGFGQSVTAPDPKTYIVNTTSQDGSGFVLSGFNSTDILLTSISLINPSTNTTFYLNTTTGLTAAIGFTLAGNKTRLVVTVTMVNINTELASLKINTGLVSGDVNISVAATVNPTGYYYNGVNGHFYKPVSAGVYYSNAKINAHATTFKGQEGYLLTLTSANEEDFIKLNVPQNNIWFAATDKVTDGTWVIDDGPEIGTVMKTQNGQLNGNIAGVYNNWCGGEPNGYNHSEDYPVAKWNGAACWNDLSNNWNNPYVIEYGNWSNPDDATFTEFYTNSVSHSNGETLKALFTFDFGSGIDKTKFLAQVFKRNNLTSAWQSTTGYKALSGLGKIFVSNQLDTAKIASGTYKATISPVGAEWAYVNPNLTFLNGNSRLLIDMRQVGNIDPTKILNIKILDAYDGPVTYVSHDPNGWAIYTVPSPLTKVTDGTSTYNQYIRNVNGTNSDYAFQCSVGIGQQNSYKQHKLELQEYDSIQLKTLYNSIVTVSDVYLAFKELANRGIMGNQTGNEFTYGIQYKNADINNDNVFNEADCFMLLQNLMGVKNLISSYTLSNTIHLYPQSRYYSIGKSNWNTYSSYLGTSYTFDLLNNVVNYDFDVSVAWKGDVNLSHSPTPPSNGVTTAAAYGIKSKAITNEINASILTEIIGDSVYAYITLDPLQQNVVGTQFQLNYDNVMLKFSNVKYTTKGISMNYANNTGTYINVGSLITDGVSSLDKTTGYTIVFLAKEKVENILGLISIGTTDAVNQSGAQLKIKMN